MYKRQTVHQEQSGQVRVVVTQDDRRSLTKHEREFNPVLLAAVHLLDHTCDFELDQSKNISYRFRADRAADMTLGSPSTSTFSLLLSLSVLENLSIKRAIQFLSTQRDEQDAEMERQKEQAKTAVESACRAGKRGTTEQILRLSQQAKELSEQHEACLLYTSPSPRD